MRFQNDVIFARDVAAVIPGFCAVAGDFRLGYVADSGAPRIFEGVELQRIARNQGVELQDLPDVCFALRVVCAAARRDPGSDAPDLTGCPRYRRRQNRDFCFAVNIRFRLAKLIFPRSGLQLPSGIQQEVLWRGFVRHSGGDFPVWAQGARHRQHHAHRGDRRISLAESRFSSNQVRLESCEDSLLDETTARNLDEVIGYLTEERSARRVCRFARRSWLRLPDVAKGELVDVQVFAGAAHLVVKAKAQSDGFKGSTITGAQSFERQRFSRAWWSERIGSWWGIQCNEEFRHRRHSVVLRLPAVCRAPKNNKKAQPKPPSALDKYIEQASQPEADNGPTVATGSLWTPAARFSDLAADQRSRRMDDIVTIVVQESASAVSTGAVKTSRQSSAQSSITALAGLTKATGPLANLANLGGQTSLNGQGTTSRTTTLTTTVSARVTHVLRNGNLVVEGTKIVGINSENQTITVRGVIRPIDLDTTNYGAVRQTGANGNSGQRQGRGRGCGAPAQYPLPAAAGHLALLGDSRNMLPVILPLLMLALEPQTNGTRLKELVSIEGVRDNQLIGYGLVVGLNGTGDTQQTLFPAQSLANLLQQMGVTAIPPPSAWRIRRRVMVTATLPPFAQPGMHIDVTVGCHGRRGESARRPAAADQPEGHRRTGLCDLARIGGHRRFRRRQGGQQPDGESSHRGPRSGRRHD